MTYPVLPDGKELKTCPECGESMKGKDPIAHAAFHYPDYIDPYDPRTENARKKKEILTSAKVPQ